MAKQTYYTHLKSFRKQLLKWLLITGSLFLITTQVWFYVNNRDYLYLAGVAMGLWILAYGLFPKYFMRRVILTVENQYLEHYRFKTILSSEKTTRVAWSDIGKINLTNTNIRLTCRDGEKLNLKLPYHNQVQFRAIKKQLQKLADANGAVFKISSFW